MSRLKTGSTTDAPDGSNGTRCCQRAIVSQLPPTVPATPRAASAATMTMAIRPSGTRSGSSSGVTSTVSPFDDRFQRSHWARSERPGSAFAAASLSRSIQPRSVPPPTAPDPPAGMRRPASQTFASRISRAPIPPSTNRPPCVVSRVQNTWSKPTLRYQMASVQSSMPTVKNRSRTRTIPTPTIVVRRDRIERSIGGPAHDRPGPAWRATAAIALSRGPVFATCAAAGGGPEGDRPRTGGIARLAGVSWIAGLVGRGFGGLAVRVVGRVVVGLVGAVGIGRGRARPTGSLGLTAPQLLHELVEHVTHSRRV